MAQIVSARLDQDGNYVLVVKPLPNSRLSKSGDTIHVAGTVGWAEPLGITTKDPSGKEVELKATVDIRYCNPHLPPKPDKPQLTVEDLIQAANRKK